jgi:hypothetical protein
MDRDLEDPGSTLAWIRAGVAASLAFIAAYCILIFAPLPDRGAAALAASWGPLLAVASLGLGRLLEVPRPSSLVRFAVQLNLLATALVTAMLLVQIAVGMEAKGKLSPEIVAIWLGLDVAWDVYIGIGTLLLACAMFRHPRFKWPFAVSGLLAAGVLLVLNLATFPTPPGEAGLFDAGPVVALWYLAVTIQMGRSLGWARSVLRA